MSSAENRTDERLEGSVGRSTCDGPGPKNTPGRVVVFDLDGTLVIRDTFGHFCAYLALKSPLRTLLLLLALPVMLVLGWHLRGRKAVAAIAIGLLTVGRSEATLAGLKASFVRQRFGPVRDKIVNEAVRRLACHQIQGDVVVVVTGCEESLARETILQLGLAQPPLVLGSHLVRRWGALVPGFHCYGAAKLVALQKAGFVPPYSFAYTDSAADLPLLKAAQKPYIVRPSGKNRVRVLRELAHVTVLTDTGDDDVLEVKDSPTPRQSK